MNAADELRFEEMERDFAALAARLNRAVALVEDLAAASGLFASDKELDGPNGDPQVKFPPRNWAGPDCKGRKFSECPPEFLDALAEALSYSAKNPKVGKEKYAKWNELDAARARSWARRLRDGWKGAAPVAGVGEFPGDTFTPPATDFGTTNAFDAPTDFGTTDDFVFGTFKPTEPF